MYLKISPHVLFKKKKLKMAESAFNLTFLKVLDSFQKLFNIEYFCSNQNYKSSVFKLPTSTLFLIGAILDFYINLLPSKLPFKRCATR